jgi:hypothetical protein
MFDYLTSGQSPDQRANKKNHQRHLKYQCHAEAAQAYTHANHTHTRPCWCRLHTNCRGQCNFGSEKDCRHAIVKTMQQDAALTWLNGGPATMTLVVLMDLLLVWLVYCCLCLSLCPMASQTASPPKQTPSCTRSSCCCHQCSCCTQGSI